MCLKKFSLLCILFSSFPAAAQDQAKEWDRWAGRNQQITDLPIVQNREISKEHRFQIMGPSLGYSERKDLYSSYFVTAGARYHLSEVHGWEIIRFTYTRSTPSNLVEEIQEQTSYVPDVQLSKFQVSTSYIFTPIYGKYAWNSSSLIYFDIFGLVGAGLRMADQVQPFGEIGLGMNHYVISNWFAVTPEIRWRFYSEKRTSSVFVMENLVQLGVSWLL